MTHEQFVYWLRGFLYGKHELKAAELAHVFDQLSQIQKDRIFYPIISHTNGHLPGVITSLTVDS